MNMQAGLNNFKKCSENGLTAHLVFTF